MNCKQCKHAQKITHNKNARCLKHGLNVLAERVLRMTDREKLKLIKLEMRFK